MDDEIAELLLSIVFWMGVVLCVIGLVAGVFWAFPDLAMNLLELTNV